MSKIKILLLLTALSFQLSVSSQRLSGLADTLVLHVDTLVAGADTLYEIDREVLVEALQRLSSNPPTRAPRKARLSPDQLLRYQMLIHLLNTQRPLSHGVMPSSSYRRNPDDIAPLLEQLLVQSRLNTEQLSNLQLQSAENDVRKNTSRSALDASSQLIDVAGNAAILAGLQSTANETRQRLAAIEAQQQAIIARLQQIGLPPSATMPPTSDATTKMMQIPADFKRSVFFYVGTSRLTTQAKATLNEAARFLHRFPTVLFDLQGYASPEGSEKRNLDLGLSRIEAVVAYLRKQGISPNRLHSATHGRIDHASQWQIGRRVDITLIQSQ